MQSIATGGALGGDGGIVSIVATNGAIQVVPDASGNVTGKGLPIYADPLSGDSLGANITVSAADKTNGGINTSVPGAPLIFSANGLGNGDGGSISVSIPSGSTLRIGTAATVWLVFNAMSGSNGGNGGTVTVNAGTISFLPTGLNINPQGANGDGGTINMIAATAINNGSGSGAVALIANGVGTGNGGNDTHRPFSRHQRNQCRYRR